MKGDWLDKLAHDSRNWSDPIPKGYMSRVEIQKRLGRKDASTVSRWLNKQISAGNMTSEKVRIITNGRCKTVPYYGPKKQAKGR